MRTALATTLKRQATEPLADILREKQSILITQHGLLGAHLVALQSYQRQQACIAIDDRPTAAALVQSVLAKRAQGVAGAGKKPRK